MGFAKTANGSAPGSFRPHAVSRGLHRRTRKVASFAVLLMLGISLFGSVILLSPPVSAQSTPIAGISDWVESTDYGSSSGTTGSTGLALNLLSCAAWSGYVYCVGGFGAPNPPSEITSKVFYAPLTQAGIGGWTETTDYGASSGSSGSGGILINAESCVAQNGYIYCVGGQTYSNGNFEQLSDVFYAPVSPSGVGAWTETTDFGASSGTTGSGGVQVYQPSCFTTDSDIYCVGGQLAGSKTFYAPISSTGVGAWTETTDYGASSGSTGTGGVSPQGTSCSVSELQGVFVYCVGGYKSDVFFAPLSASGIGAWTETTDYAAVSGTTGSGGVQVDVTSCATYSGYIFCVGGRNATAPDDTEMSNVFYAPVSSTGVGAWNATKAYGDNPTDISNAQAWAYQIQQKCAKLAAAGSGSRGNGGSRTFTATINQPGSTCSTTTTPTSSTSSSSSTASSSSSSSSTTSSTSSSSSSSFVTTSESTSTSVTTVGTSSSVSTSSTSGSFPSLTVAVIAVILIALLVVGAVVLRTRRGRRQDKGDEKEDKTREKKPPQPQDKPPPPPPPPPPPSSTSVAATDTAGCEGKTCVANKTQLENPNLINPFGKTVMSTKIAGYQETVRNPNSDMTMTLESGIDVDSGRKAAGTETFSEKTYEKAVMKIREMVRNSTRWTDTCPNGCKCVVDPKDWKKIASNRVKTDPVYIVVTVTVADEHGKVTARSENNYKVVTTVDKVTYQAYGKCTSGTKPSGGTSGVTTGKKPVGPIPQGWSQWGDDQNNIHNDATPGTGSEGSQDAFWDEIGGEWLDGNTGQPIGAK